MVNEAQGLLVAAHWCQSEVCNGGLHQFFSNSTGVLAPEAIRGFELLQIAEVPRIVAAAVAMFGSTYPRDREARSHRLSELERAGDRRSDWDPFYELDEQFYEATGSSEFADQADRFVRSHLNLFFQTVH